SSRGSLRGIGAGLESGALVFCVPLPLGSETTGGFFVDMSVYLSYGGGCHAAVGVAAAEAALSAPVPTALVALTLKVYSVSLVRPSTTMGDAVPVPVKPPGVEVAV